MERYKVRLKAHGVDAVPECWVPVSGVIEASKVCRAYIENYDLGNSNWLGGEIRTLADDQVIGRVSYNGRIWAPDGTEIARLEH